MFRLSREAGVEEDDEESQEGDGNGSCGNSDNGFQFVAFLFERVL
jgi:hypothetical protein